MNLCSRIVTFGLMISSTVAYAQDRAHQLANEASQAQPVACESVQSFQDCHSRYPDGCTIVSGNHAPHYDAYLDFLKNQLPTAAATPVGTLTQADISSKEKQIPSGITQFNHAHFADTLAGLGEGNIYTIVGYLYYDEKGSKETCNCKLTGTANIDIHIGLGFDENMAKQIAAGTVTATSAVGQPSTPAERSSMVVEMTPHYRANVHPNWDEGRLGQAIGKEVKVTGQLLLDNDHLNSKEDCGFKNANTTSCWRMSVWELHPATAFYVCKKGYGCGDNPDEWEALDNIPSH